MRVASCPARPSTGKSWSAACQSGGSSASSRRLRSVAPSLGRVQRGGLVGQVRLQDCESTRIVGQVAVGGLAGRAGSLRRLFGEALEQAMMAEQLGFSARLLLGSTGQSLTEHRQAALGHPYLLKERFGARPQL